MDFALALGQSRLTSAASLQEERELVLKAKAGDEGVWAHWYDAYYGFLYRYAYHRLWVREEAEDAAAQVFLEALKNIHRYECRDKPVLAWLYGIARNLCAARLRKRARERSATERLSAVRPSEGEGIPSSDALDLEKAMADLTPEQQEVLLLRFRIGLQTKEVARLIGKQETAVYSLQVRGIAALRRHLVA